MLMELLSSVVKGTCSSLMPAVMTLVCGQTRPSRCHASPVACLTRCRVDRCQCCRCSCCGETPLVYGCVWSSSVPAARAADCMTRMPCRCRCPCPIPVWHRTRRCGLEAKRVSARLPWAERRRSASCRPAAARTNLSVKGAMTPSGDPLVPTVAALCCFESERVLLHHRRRACRPYERAIAMCTLNTQASPEVMLALMPVPICDIDSPFAHWGTAFNLSTRTV